jgi:hypothetical protein
MKSKLEQRAMAWLEYVAAPLNRNLTEKLESCVADKEFIHLL